MKRNCKCWWCERERGNHVPTPKYLQNLKVLYGSKPKA